MKNKVEKEKKRTPSKRSFREDWKMFARGVKIWNELQPGLFACLIFCTALEACLPYFGFYMSAQLVNELAAGGDAGRLLFLAAAAVSGGFLLSAAARILRGRLNVIEGFTMEQHEEYILRMQNRHQYKYMEDPDIVLLQSGIRNDFFSFGGGLCAIRWISAEMLRGIFDLIFSVSLTVSMFMVSAQGDYSGFFAFINSPFSAAAVALMIAANAWLSIKISTASTKKSQEALSGLSESNTRYNVYGSLWSTDLIVFDLHRIVLEQMRKYQLHPEWVSKKEKVEIKYGMLSVALEAALNIAIFLFVAAKAFIGVFGIGSFILYQGTVGRFVQAVSVLASAIGRLRYNNGFLVQLYRYLDLPNDMYRGSLAVEKRDDIDYEIEFRDVSFKYPGTDNWVLRHVDMKFRIGDRLAVVGENGSGKTTFIKLLCRLYDPTEGKIFLNGIDITRYRYDEYLALFAAVFQDYTLFAFSIGENVAAGLSCDAARARDCLIRVGLEEKLAELDAAGADALEKPVGKEYDAEGIDFSGGERQKIALARGLYKDAPFVVLDEPTAALDPLAEAAVYETFNRIVKNKTSVFISHRLSSCRFCDTIAVFDHGQIVQRGTHDALVAQREGKYFQLWTAQAKYYADQGT